MNNKQYKRKQYFIDKNFQSKFILKFSLVVILASVIIGGLIFYLSTNSTTVAIENTKITVKRTADFILPIMVHTIVIVTLFSVIIACGLILLISHKISGPLFRLKREIDLMKTGDLGRDFNIRATDQLKDLALSLNLMCSTLKEKLTESKEQCKSFENFISQKDVSIQKDTKEQILELLNKLKNQLDFFKI